MNFRMHFLFVILFLSSVSTKAAILVERGSANETNETTETTKPVLKSFVNTPSASIDQMHREKRVGAGIELYGKTGLAGVTGDFAILPYDQVSAGFGGGPGFVAMNLGYKHLFSDMKLSPYASANLARWMGTSNSPMGSTNPGYLGQKFLTDREQRTGQFAHHFLIPTAGLQWTEFARNAAVYGELLALVDLDGFQNTYSGAVGMLYYF